MPDIPKININSQNPVQVPKPKQRGSLFWILTFLVLAAGALLFVSSKKEKNTNIQNKPDTSVPENSSQTNQPKLVEGWAEKQKEFERTRELNQTPQKVEEVDADLLPANFPKGIPIETVSEADILENKFETFYSGTTGIRRYLSAKSVQENYNLFKEYFSKNSWTINEYDKNSPTAMQFYGSKANQKLTIAIQKDSASGKVKVSIIISSTK